jgi:hypothetical protein
VAEASGFPRRSFMNDVLKFENNVPVQVRLVYAAGKVR